MCANANFAALEFHLTQNRALKRQSPPSLLEELDADLY
jgi:hypothetical protein